MIQAKEISIHDVTHTQQTAQEIVQRHNIKIA